VRRRFGVMAGEQLRITEGDARGERLVVEVDLLLGRAAEKSEGRLGDDPEISRRDAKAYRGARWSRRSAVPVLSDS
jgi:hypothetical protein